MLYEFYREEQKKEGKQKSLHRQIRALYHVSGLTSSPDSDQCVYTTTICGDDKLDTVCKKFTKLISLHIYAVRATTTGEVKSVDEDDDGSLMQKLSEALKEVSIMNLDQDISSRTR